MINPSENVEKYKLEKVSREGLLHRPEKAPTRERRRKCHRRLCFNNKVTSRNHKHRFYYSYFGIIIPSKPATTRRRTAISIHYNDDDEDPFGIPETGWNVRCWCLFHPSSSIPWHLNGNVEWGWLLAGWLMPPVTELLILHQQRSGGRDYYYYEGKYRMFKSFCLPRRRNCLLCRKLCRAFCLTPMRTNIEMPTQTKWKLRIVYVEWVVGEGGREGGRRSKGDGNHLQNCVLIVWIS